jgi:hypothetical protein
MMTETSGNQASPGRRKWIAVIDAIVHAIFLIVVALALTRSG